MCVCMYTYTYINIATLFAKNKKEKHNKYIRIKRTECVIPSQIYN